MARYDSVRFPESISQGATSGPLYTTDVTNSDSGGEGRVSVWEHGRMTYEVGHATKGEDHVAELIAFFRCRRGRLYAFRFKDWDDYKADGEPTSLIGTITAGDQPGISSTRVAYDLTVDTSHFPPHDNPYDDRYFYFPIPFGVYDSASIDITYTITITSTEGGGGPQIVCTYAIQTAVDHDADFTPTDHTTTMTDGSGFLLDAVNAVAPNYNPLHPEQNLLRLECWMGGGLLDVGTADIHSMTLNLHASGSGPSDQQLYQLIKRYDDGVNAEDRIIQAPIDSITLLDGASPATGATIDYTTGLVLISPPPSGALTWSGEFDVVCRFDTDKMEISAEGGIDQIVSTWNNVPLIEVIV